MIYRKIPLFLNSEVGDGKYITDNGSKLQISMSPSIIIPSNKKAVFRVLLASLWYVMPNISESLEANPTFNPIQLVDYPMSSFM